MGIDTDQFVAGEGGHLDLLTVQRVGRQLAGGVVVAPNFISVVCTPGAVDASNQSAVLQLTGELLVLQGDEAGVLTDINDSLGNVSARGLIPVADGIHAVISQAQVQAGASIEAVQVPAVRNVHRDFLACVGCLLHHRVKALDIVLGEEALVVEHEVAVVSGQGVSIQLAIDRGSIDRRGSVAALDIVRIQLHFLQSASLDQLVQLVIGKSINISSGGGVGQDGILGRGLGLRSQIDGDLAAVVAVLLDELVADFTQQILILFSAPHGQGNILSEGSGSSLVENVALSSSALCGALGSGGSSLSGRGCCAAGRAATAGCQRQGHDTGHGKAQLLFHNCVLLLLLVFARCSNNSQCCAIMLRSCFTILRIQDFCAGVNAHN